LPAHLSTRLKVASSSFGATGDVILSVPHIAATALLHITYRFYGNVSFPNFNNTNVLLYSYYLVLNAVIL